MNEDILAKLHDIKELEKIPDNSVFIFSFLIFLALILIITIIFFIVKFFKNRKKSDRKKYYEILQNINFGNSKESAYVITKYTRLLARNEREKKLSEEIIEELEKFKYKKNVKQIDDTIKAKFSTFMDSVDV
jgi:flagellar biogenesis protein FliO